MFVIFRILDEFIFQFSEAFLQFFANQVRSNVGLLLDSDANEVLQLYFGVLVGLFVQGFDEIEDFNNQLIIFQSVIVLNPFLDG